MIVIVVEGAEHRSQVRAVNRESFGSDVEANLVDALREAGLVVSSLVAVSGGEVARHILFSDLAPG